MRFRVFDRMLAALSGLLIFFLGVALALYGVGLFPAVDWSVLQGPFTIWQRVVIVAVALLLCLLGIHGLWMLFRRRADKGFIVQRTDLGDMSIAMTALSSMVNKCVDQHQEVSVKKIRIHRIRDGIIVDLKILLANGINIPLTVNVLQKQIKQYITSCSGVDVHEVRVQIGTSDLPVEDKKEDTAAPAIEQTVPALHLQDEPVVEVAAEKILRHTEEPADYVEPIELVEAAVQPVQYEATAEEQPLENAEEAIADEIPAAASEEMSFVQESASDEDANEEAMPVEVEAVVSDQEAQAVAEELTDTVEDLFEQADSAIQASESETVVEEEETSEVWSQIGDAFVRRDDNEIAQDVE